MTTHTIPTKPTGYPSDLWRATDAVLVFRGKRFSLSITPASAASRVVTGGPLVPGPHAESFELGSTIAANPEHGTYGEMKRLAAAGLVFNVAVGDVVDLDGARYTVASGMGFRPDYLRLDLIAEAVAV